MKFGKLRPTLLYWGMKQVEGGARLWTQLGAYGGLLAENVTQAVARDILSDTMLYRVTIDENRVVRIALHVHDELVCEVDEDDEDALPRLERACRVVPDWATGLPLAVKGWTGKHYSK